MCRLYRVTGRVQGVFFRASTAEQARRLLISGHALNLPDGSVEVLACGTTAALDELEVWLAHGPQMADVAGVERTDRAFVAQSGFKTG